MNYNCRIICETNKADNVTFYGNANQENVLETNNLSLVCPQHYTKDADGLCTRLIKPKLMEGTVAAQDEFSRSKDTLSSLNAAPQRTPGHYCVYVTVTRARGP